ncbi:hypothetical protein QBC38DRAFT_462630, partial [Podospora fimiseda]
MIVQIGEKVVNRKGRFQQQFVAGRNGPVHGWLLDHIMMQEIVDVDSTGVTRHLWSMGECQGACSGTSE